MHVSSRDDNKLNPSEVYVDLDIFLDVNLDLF